MKSLPLLRNCVVAAIELLIPTAITAAAGSTSRTFLIVADDMIFRCRMLGARFRHRISTGWRVDCDSRSSTIRPVAGHHAPVPYRLCSKSSDALPGLGGGAGGVRPTWARLLPEMLRPLGYRSYHSGKWHVDGRVLAGGFDHSYSFNDHNRYFSPREHTLDDQPLPPVEPGSGYYATTAIAQHAIDMLAGHQAGHANEPFFFIWHSLHRISPPRLAAGHRALPGLGTAPAGTRCAGALRTRKIGSRQLRAGTIRSRDSAVGIWGTKLREQIGREKSHMLFTGVSLEQKEFQPIKMALHAAMIHRMDIEWLRPRPAKAMGALDDTIIFFLITARPEEIIGATGTSRRPPGSARLPRSAPPSGRRNTRSDCISPGSTRAASGALIVHWPKGIVRGANSATIPAMSLISRRRFSNWLAANPGADGGPLPPGKSLVPVFEG
jgi:arylsulfatase